MARIRRADESHIIDGYGSYEVDLKQVYKYSEENNFKLDDLGREYTICKKCGENTPVIREDIKRGGGAWYFMCLKCNHTTITKPQVRVNKAKIRRDCEEMTRQMVRTLIPGQRTPTVYFNEKEAVGAVEQAGFKLSPSRNCLAWAVSEVNIIHVPNRAFDIHRYSYTETIAHETAHLSPKRIKTAEYYENEFKFAKMDDKGGYTTDYTRSSASHMRENMPERWNEVLGGFPDNKCPTWALKEEFEGAYNPKGTGKHRWEPNWGAGGGHGNEWFAEYHNYRGQLLGNGTFSQWIREGDKKAWKPPSTFSAGWFRDFGFEGDPKTFKEWGKAENYGEEFGAESNKFDGDFI